MISCLIDWLKAPKVVKTSNRKNESEQPQDFGELAELLEHGAADAESLERIAQLLGQKAPD